jgi:hypothetical protein
MELDEKIKIINEKIIKKIQENQYKKTEELKKLQNYLDKLILEFNTKKIKYSDDLQFFTIDLPLKNLLNEDFLEEIIDCKFTKYEKKNETTKRYVIDTDDIQKKLLKNLGINFHSENILNHINYRFNTLTNNIYVAKEINFITTQYEIKSDILSYSAICKYDTKICIIFKII